MTKYGPIRFFLLGIWKFPRDQILLCWSITERMKHWKEGAHIGNADTTEWVHIHSICISQALAGTSFFSFVSYSSIHLILVADVWSCCCFFSVVWNERPLIETLPRTVYSSLFHNRLEFLFVFQYHDCFKDKKIKMNIQNKINWFTLNFKYVLTPLNLTKF